MSIIDAIKNVFARVIRNVAKAAESLATQDVLVTANGEIVIKAQESRSQDKNRADALERLAALIREAIRVPKKRRPTTRSMNPTRLSPTRIVASRFCRRCSRRAVFSHRERRVISTDSGLRSTPKPRAPRRAAARRESSTSTGRLWVSHSTATEVPVVTPHCPNTVSKASSQAGSIRSCSMKGVILECNHYDKSDRP